MKVYLVYEGTYSSWLPSAVDDEDFLVYATREAAEAFIAAKQREDVERELASERAHDPLSNYELIARRRHIAAMRAGTEEGAWYDVGLVRNENGVEVWKTARRTVEDEEKLLAARERHALAEYQERIAKLVRMLEDKEPLPAGDWEITEKEVIE